MTAKRQLPAWMTAAKPRSHDSTDSTDPSLKFLSFPGKLIYCYQSDECNEHCEDIIKQSDGQSLIIGFDMEWKVSYQQYSYNKTSIIQLCIGHNTCYIFQVIHMKSFPVKLKELLSMDTIKKVGVGIQGDVQRLLTDYNVTVNGVVDLGDFANEKCGIYERWSLNGLLMNKAKHAKLNLRKDVQTSLIKVKEESEKGFPG